MGFFKCIDSCEDENRFILRSKMMIRLEEERNQAPEGHLNFERPDNLPE